MNKKKYVIFTSYLGFFILGVYLMIKIYEKPKEQHQRLLIALWIKAVMFFPAYFVISLTTIVADVFLFDLIVWKYVLYILCVLTVYILGVFSIKNLIKWKNQMDDIDFFNRVI